MNRVGTGAMVPTLDPWDGRAYVRVFEDASEARSPDPRFRFAPLQAGDALFRPESSGPRA
jgi:hypothetical protein